MQTKIIKSNYSEILSNVNIHTLRNASAGSCNLLAEHINSYGSPSINEFIAAWLEENIHALNGRDEIAELLDNPDTLILSATHDFLSALESLVSDPDRILMNCRSSFDAYEVVYFLYANPWSNSCTDYYLMRASSGHEALSQLIDVFENDFMVEDDNISLDDIINENGNHVNIDNLTLIGSFCFSPN